MKNQFWLIFSFLGVLSVLLISTKEAVFLFDIIALSDKVCFDSESPLRILLEDSGVTKVLHDSRIICDLLHHKVWIIKNGSLKNGIIVFDKTTRFFDNSFLWQMQIEAQHYICFHFKVQWSPIENQQSPIYAVNYLFSRCPDRC